MFTYTDALPVDAGTCEFCLRLYAANSIDCRDLTEVGVVPSISSHASLLPWDRKDLEMFS